MKDKITIIGLGYVGLPLAQAFSEKFELVAFDISQSRIEELKSGFDKTLELTKSDLEESSLEKIEKEKYNAIILAFAHKEFMKVL